MTERPRGRVYLVGAGPGDPELLTLKAARILGDADAILVDALVDRRVLAHTRPDARVIEVGKRGGCRSTPQAFIERLMVRFARAGAVVVRLKGGDPFVFGRGGEEAIALRRAGVEFEVVPGLSAGIAGPAAAGIPVTHRGVASAVTFVSGHIAASEAPDWAALVQSKATLVVFMGVATLPDIARALLEAGLSPATPAAIVERATFDDQRVVTESVARIAGAARAAAVRTPALFVVGNVVDVASQIRSLATSIEFMTRAA